LLVFGYCFQLQTRLDHCWSLDEMAAHLSGVACSSESERESDASLPAMTVSGRAKRSAAADARTFKEPNVLPVNEAKRESGVQQTLCWQRQAIYFAPANGPDRQGRLKAIGRGGVRAER